MTVEQPIWTPSPERVAESNVTAFLAHIRDNGGPDLPNYDALWQWSIDNIEPFWCALWDFSGIISETRGERILVNGEDIRNASFFPDARLNFAENLLRVRGSDTALWFRNERGAERRISWDELHSEVARLGAALRDDGVQPGDRIAAYMPNIPETVIVALAAISIGAVFSSCAPDFGAKGVVDRLAQTEPTVLFAADGYYYNGKTHDALGRLPEILDGLPSVKRTVVIPYVSGTHDIGDIAKGVLLPDYVADRSDTEIVFERLPFDHPVFIMFSSGTTGVPKCIVHRAGGVLLQEQKEILMTNDLKPGDRVFFRAGTSWMVWNVHLAHLGGGAALLLYDGSPFYPSPDVLFDYVAEARATHFGTSAKFIDALKQQRCEPAKGRDLSALRLIMTSGSPLAPESFEYVYEHIKSDLHLAPVSGGTDLMAAFVGGDPTGPVWRGEMQCRMLGMAVEVFDDDGKPLPAGEQGELVCTRPFPSVPLSFLNDPDGTRLGEAYFDHFPGAWRHGDLMAITENGGAIIYGRSDATLNPGGIRIGTAEIYRQVERLEEVTEALAIGQDWPPDTRIVLFVQLRDGFTLDDQLADRIKSQIRENTTPRHVPAVILQVPDIPRTKTGKIVELAVRNIVHGRSVKNVDALANPEALEHFRDRPELSV